jgi:phosphoribosylformylglycinamidine synthase PurS subunit
LKAKIKVYLKPGILDPQGKAVLHAINDLKYSDVGNVRIGKYVEITFNDGQSAKIRKETEDICSKLLANPVMENYEIEFEE